jgi:hypothetical protein
MLYTNFYTSSFIVISKVAHDRNGQILSQMAGRGRITAIEIDEVLGKHIDISGFAMHRYSDKLQKIRCDEGLTTRRPLMFVKVSIRRKEFTIFSTSTSIILA